MDNQQDAREGVTLDVMAERLADAIDSHRGTSVSKNAARHYLACALTGMDPGPDRDAALADLLARLGRPVDRQGDGEVSPAPAGLVEAVRAVLANHDWSMPNHRTHEGMRALQAALDAALSAQAGAAPGVGELAVAARAALSVLDEAHRFCNDEWIGLGREMGEGSQARSAYDMREQIADASKPLRRALRGSSRLASQPGGGPVAAGEAGIYIASKAIHGPRWRRYRDAGWPINSTWINEAEAGRTTDWLDLWDRCATEPAKAAVTILYREEGEELKGALVEAGAALSHGRTVIVVGPLDHSFARHRRVERAANMDMALVRAKDIAALGASSGGEGSRG